MKNANIIESKPSIVWITNELLNDKIDANLMHSKFINMLDNQYLELKSNMDIKLNNELIDELTDYTANGSFKSLSENVEYTDESGIPFVRIKNMSEVGLVLEDFKYITIESYNYLKKSKLQGNELLFSKTGANLGLAMVFPNNFRKASLADNTFKVIYKKDHDTHYIASFFNSKYGRLWIERLSQGSAQSTIIKESFRQIKIPIPPFQIQKYIGDKVRKAEELRAEAKILKKEAENLIDKYLGGTEINNLKQYSAQYISYSNISERIDSEYYHSKYLLIEQKLKAKGFNLIKLEELCTKIFNGKTCKVNTNKSKYLNIGVGELGEWFIEKNSNKYITEVVNDKYVLSENCIIWGNSAHLAKYIGEKVNIILENNTLVPTTEIIAIQPNEEKINPYYLFLFMNSKWGYFQIQRTVKGMTAHSYPQDIANILVPIIKFNNEEEILMKDAVKKSYSNEILSKKLIQEAKQDVEDLIEGNFDMSKLD